MSANNWQLHSIILLSSHFNCFQIAAEVSAPLAKTDEIVLIGGQDKTTAEVSKLCGSLPPAVQALTGVDINAVGDMGLDSAHRNKQMFGKQGTLASIHNSNTTSRPQTQIKLGSAFHMH